MKLNSPLPQSLSKECEKAAKIFKSFVDSGNNGLDGVIPRSVLENARGFAIFTVFKAGFLFSARAGSGVVIAKLEDGSWSAPSAIGCAGLGVGGQVGAEMTDFLVVLNSPSAVKSFMAAGSLTLGGNLSVAVGPLGRNGEAIGSVNSSGKLAAMYSYSKTRGLFGGVSIEGTVIVERQDANAQAYRQDVTVKSLLSGAISPPEWAMPLIRTLETCTGMPGGRRWVHEFRGSQSEYMFGGVESPRDEDVPPADYTFEGTGSANSRLQKKGRSASLAFPPASWGKRKNSGSYFADDFHDPSRAPVPVDLDGALPSSALPSPSAPFNRRVSEDRPSPRLEPAPNPTTGYFATKFTSDYVPDDQLRRHPPLSTRSGTGAREDWQPGSPFNSLPPFSAARSTLSGTPTGVSDVASHRRAFSAYAPTSSNGRNPFSGSPQSDPFELPGDEDADDLEYGRSSPSAALFGSSVRNPLQKKLTAKAELTRSLLPYEGVARAIALYDFNAVQSGDLSFRKGQVITVTKKSDDTNTWWTGKLEGREGMFPANFVEVV
ncbi:DUF500-domain-containing protein [Obba rivulosa]|uniref:DUF500-domain-containing protein n=1 Tax=Obba rivulosa TaxID=1052685 RepID=A0A8E2DNT2_9APHY|nr:DUF500-domain-containing protein [Obba rivulosa]